MTNIATPLGQMCLAAFEAAAASPIGHEITTNNSYRARMALYKFRSENPNNSWNDIQINISPDNPEKDLWLIQKTPFSSSSSSTAKSSEEIEL